MIKIYTSRLYFKKFPYRVTISRSGQINKKIWANGWTPIKCTRWLEKKSFNFRSRTKVRLKKRIRQVSVTMTLFLETRAAYEACIKKYEQYITSILEPYSDTHIELLKNNANILIRKQRIYKKFKYVVNFRRTYHQPIDDIDDWVIDNFKQNLFFTKTMKWVSSGRNPRLYIENQEDLVFVKLTWGERIREIIVVQTLDELNVPASLR